MSKVKKPDFHLINKTIKNISQSKGVVLLSSQQAWDSYSWSRKFFKTRPELGYFLWVKKTPPNSLSSCISLADYGFEQKLVNLVVVEPRVKVKIKALCNALADNLSATHQGRSKIIVKKAGFLEVFHQHFWGGQDLVLPQLDFLLEDQAKLAYIYKNDKTPRRLEMKNSFSLQQGAKAESKLIIRAKKSQVKIKESLSLAGRDTCGNLILRLVGEEKSAIKAVSQITARQPSRGHLDCQGLLVDPQVKVSLTPKLVNFHNQALITHEASIGKIEKDQLEYLQSRGLSQAAAVNLIIRGFLNEKNN